MKIVVAPLAGARIEIARGRCLIVPLLSLPSRERGLKSLSKYNMRTKDTVAPLAGARIEICFGCKALHGM